jgi:hypothetical protein
MTQKCLHTIFFILLMSISILGMACKDLYPISVGDKWGYINCKGQVVVEPKFSSSSNFLDGVGIITINENKSISATPKFSSGIIDSNGKLTLLPNYRLYSDFSEGLALAKSKGRWFFINKQGKEVLSINHIAVDEEVPLSSGFKDGIAILNSIGKVYLVKKNGEIINHDEVISSIGFFNGTEIVFVDKGFTLRDTNKNYLVPFNKNPIYFSDGLFLIETKDRKWQYVDNQGHEILLLSYSYAGLFIDGLAVVEINKKWGYSDKKGELTIPTKFDEARDFSDGLASVKFSDKYGFINKSGKFIIPPKFDYVITTFRHGLAYVQKGNFEGYINKKGRWIWKKQTN